MKGKGLLLAALLLPAAAAGTECIDYRDHLHRIASPEFPAGVHDVALGGGFAYVVGDAGLHVLDLSDPAEPALVGEAAFPAGRGIALSGTLAAVACADSAFRLFDLAEPAHPVALGELFVTGPLHAVAIAGEHAVVAADGTGLHVIDLSDPQAPFLLHTIDTPRCALDVALDGGYAFVADRADLHVVDYLNPVTPDLAPGDRPDAYILAVAVANGYAYTLDATFGIHVFDVADPLAPAFVYNLHAAGEGGLAIAGGKLYAGTSPGLQVFSLEKPCAPLPLGGVNLSVGRGVPAIDGDIACVAAGGDLLDIVDVSSPTEPEEIGYTYISTWVRQVALTETHAFAATSYHGVQVVDITDPANPVVITDADVPDRSEHLVIAGDLAYVASGSVGFHVLDISVPHALGVVGACLVPDDALWVDFAPGSTVVLANATGLVVIDVADPASPTIVGSLATEGRASSVAVVGHHAIVASESRLLSVDVSDPTAPILVASVPVDAEVVAVDGDLLAVAGNRGLRLFDVADPGNPLPRGVLPLPGFQRGIALVDGIAWIGCMGGGLQLIDVTDPDAPAPLGSSSVYGGGLALGEGIVVVAEIGRLSIYPGHCVATGIHPGGEPLATFPSLLRPNHPNPFAESTRLAFTLRGEARVELAIFDPRGRRLRTLRAGRLGAGEHAALWDGRDERGRRLAAGVYLSRLEVDGRVEARRLLLLR